MQGRPRHANTKRPAPVDRFWYSDGGFGRAATTRPVEATVSGRAWRRRLFRAWSFLFREHDDDGGGGGGETERTHSHRHARTLQGCGAAATPPIDCRLSAPRGRANARSDHRPTGGSTSTLPNMLTTSPRPAHLSLPASPTQTSTRSKEPHAHWPE